MLVLLSTGCSSGAAGHGPKIERTFDVSWRDTASSLAVHYTTRHVVFHDGRWSADISVTNESPKALYQAIWSPPDSDGVTWNGPALVYSGLDVLQERRLIFVPADDEQPNIPFPLRPGATWRGTISGKVPARPPLPKASDIWVRYPVFGIGQVWDGFTQSFALTWFSQRAVRL